MLKEGKSPEKQNTLKANVGDTRRERCVGVGGGGYKACLTRFLEGSSSSQTLPPTSLEQFPSTLLTTVRVGFRVGWQPSHSAVTALGPLPGLWSSLEARAKGLRRAAFRVTTVPLVKPRPEAGLRKGPVFTWAGCFLTLPQSGCWSSKGQEMKQLVLEPGVKGAISQTKDF